MADHTFYTAWLRERDRADAAEAEVRALTARLDAAHKIPVLASEVKQLMDGYGWPPVALPDINRVLAAARDLLGPATADPTPPCATCGGTRKVDKHIKRIVARRSIPDTVKVPCPDCATADPTPHPDTPKWDPEVFPSETFPDADPAPHPDGDT
jgi:hypothetical protein